MMNFLRLSAALLLSGSLLNTMAQVSGTQCRNNDLDLLAPLHQWDPDRLAEMQAADEALEVETAAFDESRGGGNYVIPVVFHIIHNNGPENIGDAQIEDAVRVLNEDFNKLNVDWPNVRPEFLGIVADVGFTLRLAQKDPSGNCSKGITRTISELTNDGTQDMKDLIQWPRNKYLNIWVCAYADGAAGYTQTPGSVSSAWAAPADGIVVLHTYTGSIGTSSLSRSRTLTHEVGHWINLRHCWGPTNTPGDPDNCSSDDNVGDTPNTEGWVNCNLLGATCGSVIDNVENYMEYSYCGKMFTNGQRTRMHSAINSSTAQRNQLWQPGNLTFTGTTGVDQLCAADFISDLRAICAGGQVQFSDQSYHGATSWEWSFPGGTPSTSTDEAPLVTYDTPGLYPVTITASNGIDDATTTVNSYITVMANPGMADPYSEDFESIAAIPDAEWQLWNPNDDETFQLMATAGYSGTHSVRMGNYWSEATNIDELLSPTIDLGNATTTLLTFRYALARRNADNDDTLRVYASNDCGATWSMRKQWRGATNLPTVPDQNSIFTPNDAADWGYAEVTNISANYHVSDFRFKFYFMGDGGNNLWLDDINVNGVPVGVQEMLVLNGGLAVVPNPVDDRADLYLDLRAGGATRIELLDVLGRTVQVVHDGMLASGEQRLTLPTSGMQNGMYMVRMTQGERSQLVRFTVN